MTRLLIRLIILSAIVWCAWWALASYGVSRGVMAWVEARRAEGWQVEAQTSQGGFPLNIRTHVSVLRLVNPENNAVFSAQGGSLRARTYWPGHLYLDLPDTPILFDGPVGELAFAASNGGAKLRLHPGTALELGSIEIFSDNWEVRLNDVPLFQGDALVLDAAQDSDRAATYEITINADNLTPGALLRQILSLPADWPAAFERFAATASVMFDAPLSRTSLDCSPPQFRQITLDTTKIIWGEIALSAVGSVEIDATGLPSGEVIMQAKDWRRLLDLAQDAGALPALQRGQAELLLGLLAQRLGEPENLDLALTFAAGQMTLSGIPLGPAPRLVLE
ncbi:MAG: DUF2125 domain-containing protein [Sulfitobacter sp.]